jgi:hypothetical protein
MKPTVRIRERAGERLEVLVDLGDRTLLIGKYRNTVEASRRESAITRIIEAAYEAGRREQARRRCATCQHAHLLPSELPCAACLATETYDGWQPPLAGGAK